MNTSNKPNIIEVRNLTKTYKKTPAVNNLKLNVKKGEIFGFLGPNGAGKKTKIKSMLGLIYPTTGNIKIKNHEIHKFGKKVKKYIGYMPERIAFYDNLTGLQNLEFYASIKNVEKNECVTLIEEMGLSQHAHKKVGDYSKGMNQRLGMARAVLGNPEILILDEPSGGLDPRGVRLIREKIKSLNNEGVTIFISSHILSEIQSICSQIGIINQGSLVAQDTVLELSKNLKVKPKLIMEFLEVNDRVVEIIKNIPGVESLEINGKYISINCLPEKRAEVIANTFNAGGKIINIQTEEASLEDIFMRITGS